MIIGITGTNGAGKGAVVDYLVTQREFTHYSVREYLTQLLEEKGAEITRPSLGVLADELRAQHGGGHFSSLFVAQMQIDGVENAVIESLRSPGEVETLHSLGGILLAIDANRTIRYSRIAARGSETDHVDFDTFVEQEEKEWSGNDSKKMNIPEVMSMADYKIQNDGTLDELYAQIENFLKVFGTT